jgi:hypothetical protein
LRAPAVDREKFTTQTPATQRGLPKLVLLVTSTERQAHAEADAANIPPGGPRDRYVRNLLARRREQETERRIRREKARQRREEISAGERSPLTSSEVNAEHGTPLNERRGWGRGDPYIDASIPRYASR